MEVAITTLLEVHKTGVSPSGRFEAIDNLAAILFLGQPEFWGKI